MVNRFSIVGLLIGLVFGVLFMILMDKDVPRNKPETKLYEWKIKKLEQIIEVQKKEISDREKRDSVKIETIYKDRIIYRTIYEKIPYSSTPDRDSAFDTLLSK